MNRVAVVDDNESWCFVIAAFLQGQGYKVSTFTSSTQFLQTEEHFDLVFVDFSMPARNYERGMDGPDLIASIRDHTETPPTLVLMSAYFLADSLQEFHAICPEADACLAKTTDLSEFLSRVKSLLAAKLSPEATKGLGI
jgi:CheY-like chemotaxis protein